jgi:hypothetical protein
VLEKNGEDHWTGRVRNEETLHGVKEERNIVHRVKRRKADWIGYIWRSNCLVRHVIEGKMEGRIEVTRRQGRRPMQLLTYLKGKRRYCKLKEEAVDRTACKTGFGDVVRLRNE